MTNDTSEQRARDSDAGVRHNARLGLVLFALYLALYGGFVALSAFDPGRMAQPSLLGLNLSIVYGVGLIVAALVLALVYMLLCRPTDAEPAAPGATSRAPAPSDPASAAGDEALDAGAEEGGSA